MEALIIVLLLALIGAVAAVGWLLVSQQRKPPEEPSEAQRMEQHLAALRTDLSQALQNSQQTVLQQVASVDARLNQRLDAVDSRVGQSLSNTNQTMQTVHQRLGQLAESTQHMLEVGRDISSLQDILKPPKVRGGFGELLLERLLAQTLPEKHYSVQHRFNDGMTVDAVIHLGNGVVPIDSKFPLEAFNRMIKAGSDEERASLRREFVRAVRGHIDAVAKYIQPDEGSFPFALMYIPAENVYYEVIVKDDLIDAHANLSSYALERRVIPVSPNSFYAYLQAIVLGLKGMRVEERAHEIIRHLEHLTGEFHRIRKEFGTLGTHLKNASDRYSDIDRSFTKFGDRLAVTMHEPVQAPLPDSAAAPAPRGEPMLSNGSEEH